MGYARTILLAAVALAATAAPAGAIEPWSAARTLQGATKGAPEAATRIAINPAGQSVVAWADASSHIRVSSGDRRGTFGQVKSFGRGLRPTVAIAPDGAAVVLWARGGALYEAYRPSATARFQAARRITLAHARDGDDFPQAVVRPNGRVVVVYENAYRTTSYHTRLRTLDLVRGAPTAVVELGAGQIGRGMPVRVSPQGAVTVCCASTATSTPARAILVRAAGASAFTPLSVADAVNGAAVASDGTVAVGATKVTRGGEAITIGVPEALRGADTLTAPLASTHPAFGGDVAYDAEGRLYLLWQQKTRSNPFSNAAPLFAAIAHGGDRQLGRRLELDPGDVTEPQLAVSDRGVVAAWRGAKGQWEVALFSGGEGRPSFGSVPAGGPTEYHDYVTNRWLAAAGDYAALAWEGHDGAIHASVKRLG